MLVVLIGVIGSNGEIIPLNIGRFDPVLPEALDILVESSEGSRIIRDHLDRMSRSDRLESAEIAIVAEQSLQA